MLHPTDPKIIIRNLRIHDDYDEGADGRYFDVLGRDGVMVQGKFFNNTTFVLEMEAGPPAERKERCAGTRVPAISSWRSP